MCWLTRPVYFVYIQEFSCFTEHNLNINKQILKKPRENSFLVGKFKVI